MFRNTKKRLYLDFASRTPTQGGVVKTVARVSGIFTNPSALYKEGVEAALVLKEARKTVALELCAREEEIIFTSGGTEGNNLAILGVFKAAKLQNPEKKCHFIFSTIEHSSVLECARHLEEVGAEVTYISPEKDGLVLPEKIREAITEHTLLVSLQLVNNEIGTIQKIAEVAKEIRHFKKRMNRDLVKPSYPYLHTDACQAPSVIKIDSSKLHFDLATLDGGKIYGPQGVGALFVRKGVLIKPLILGGGQEAKLRSGTEALPQIVGFREALSLCSKKRDKEWRRLSKFQNFFWSELKKNFPEAIVNGSQKTDERVPFICNFGLPGIDSEFYVFNFDGEGIAISSASSCLSTKENSFSYVVKEVNEGLENSSLRVSFGRTTKKRHITRFFKVLSMIESRNKNFKSTI